MAAMSMETSGMALAVDFLAVADLENQYQEAMVFELADQAVVAYAILPKFTEA